MVICLFSRPILITIGSSRSEVWPLLPDTVKCKICGRLYNKRYLHGHMLRSHSKRKKVSGKSSETEIIEEILSLFQRLSKEGQESLQERLSNSMRG